MIQVNAEVERRFYARYQPVVDLATRRPVAYAASLWARDAAGEVPAARLFAAARTPAAQADLDRLARATALREAAPWLGSALLLLRLIPAMVDRPREALADLPELAAQAAVPMARIVIEVALEDDSERLAHVARVVTRCRGSGCLVAVSGAADRTSARRATALVPDFVKLAPGLAAGLDRSARDGRAAPREALREVVDAVHEAGARSIVFGVESAEQAEQARLAGADLAQGYLYGRPRPPDRLFAGPGAPLG